MRSVLLFALALLQAPASQPVRHAVSFPDSRQPQVAVAADGAVYVAMLHRGNIAVARSDDRGTNFGTPVVAIDANGRAEGGLRRGPRIGVASDGSLAVTAPVCFDPKELGEKYPRADLWLVRSRDRGGTWSVPVRINETEKAAPEALHWMAVAPSGDVHAAWLDQRESRGNSQDLFYARVRGGEVGKNVRLASNVCECCAPGIAVDGKGNPYVAVREGGKAHDRGILLAVSRDQGASFSNPFQLVTGKSGVSG